MKKWCLVFVVLLFAAGSMNILYSEEYRIYNDGIIDYVPLTASFVLSAEDFGSSLMKIQYSVDGSPLRDYSSPITLSGEGRHVIIYRALDKTSNISSEKIYPVVVDATPPDGLASADGPVYVNERKFYVTGDTTILLWAEDNLSGVDSIYVSLDGGGFMKYTDPLLISNEGLHTARIYAVDNVGNRTSTYVIEGYVDNTPPEVRIMPAGDLVSIGGKYYTGKDNEFTVTASDGISGVREIMISLDGSKYATYSTRFKVQKPGDHTLRAKAVDNLGNESYPVEITFSIDAVPPEATMGVSIVE